MFANFLLLGLEMSENYSEDKREENKPDEEVSTSQDPHQTDPSEDEKAFDRFSEA
ncbi:hypothetical protein T07_13774 [Trichinella nelsoni]|uniref:Uncharacterized protein n=1 Tax=Trichinella nelsoni TaxID=6336 RepID=A0A0V0RF38_9BILA|nr:hypothetical protein T07_13774 [Trichinella nelsoni]